MLGQEASRVLTLAGLRPLPKEEKPPADDLDGWNKLLSEPGDAAAGRRLFFNSIGARCGVCHQHAGRGGRIGPDLTNISRSNNREQIIASLLQPSREIAPHYQPWLLVTNDGKTHFGLRKAQGGDNGIETYIDSAGNEFALRSDTIDERHAATKSIMPDNIAATLSIADLRDLVTFLSRVPPN
jgi:putative heme-binding domain-containing protein